ncbi:MAG: GNAT family N-acetyltransferase [Proteobacteria bacterium]|nr:GNAT family N-acetyltransferase [Pseudomonadota bacterium]
MDLILRPYQPGDENQILGLRARVFGDADPVRSKMAAWKWQFADNPAGPGFIHLAEDAGRVKAQYAAIPTRMRVNGREEVFGFSCDTMVHPNYRKQGLFAALARECYARMEAQHGVRVVWGFPNEKSMPGFVNRLGWERAGSAPTRLTLPHPALLLSPILRHARGAGDTDALAGPAGDAVIEPVDRFGEEFDALWEQWAPAEGVVQVRDAAYLNWRYLGLADFGYRPYAVRDTRGRLAGWFVIRPMPLFGAEAMVLADLWPLPPLGDLARAVVQKIRRTAATAGSPSLVALFPPAWAGLTRKLGFLAVPDRVSPKKWNLALRRPAGPEASPPADISQWFLSLGDTDIV